MSVPPVTADDGRYRGFSSMLKLRLHRPAKSRSTPPLAVYLHRSRFMEADLAEADQTAQALAARLGVAVAVPGYSLATERPFPAAAEDAYAALEWVRAHAHEGHWSARKLLLIGEEAGGNLAAVVAMMARDRGLPAPIAQVLVAPMLDPTLSSASMSTAHDAAARCGEAYRCYLPQAADRLHPYAAPGLCTRLAGLAPALILTAQEDPLRDEAESYGAKLIGAGVKTQVARLPALRTKDGWHADAWREIAAFLAPLLHSKRTVHSTRAP